MFNGGWGFHGTSIALLMFGHNKSDNNTPWSNGDLKGVEPKQITCAFLNTFNGILTRSWVWRFALEAYSIIVNYASERAHYLSMITISDRT